MKTLNTLIGAAVLATALASCNGSSTKETSTDSTTTESMGAGDTLSMGAEGSSTTTTTVVPGSYRDLKTGKKIYVVRDPQTGYAYDSIARVPVDFYINDANDTLYRTGQVVNNAIIKSNDGTWKLDDTKVKVDGDEIKVKDDDSKVKMEDGNKSKVKVGDYKKKTDGDEVKEKTPTTKSKTEDGVTTTKPRN
ncbi:MAG: hypothetical protein K0S09_2236 [Sphingobacteriaceae bacterium]|jgi:hypothetical protein|nr:hypothetical protein [Sphingobacteriaceae bacterium]